MRLTVSLANAKLKNVGGAKHRQTMKHVENARIEREEEEQRSKMNEEEMNISRLTIEKCME